MSSAWSWPALEPAAAAIRGGLPPLSYERGVWGKVHGAPSDFRWIARSPGLDPALVGEILLGDEDAPRRGYAWRALGEVCCAVHFYPSRASDAAGRRGFLEKQVLAWAPRGLPAALGALLLLPRVAEWGDEVWWDRAGDPGWYRSAFHLPLEREDVAPGDATEKRLEEALAKGLDALISAVPEESLRRLYTDLAAGRRPALLAGLAGALVPEALAALLLPLPAATAAHLSLAGGVPSRRTTPDLGKLWDVIAVGDERSARQPEPAPPEACERAERWVAAVLDRRPPTPSPASRDAQPAPGPQLELDDTWETLPPEIVTLPSAPSARSEPLRPEATSARPGPGLTLELPPPDGEPPPLLEALYEFARRVDRRWLDPRELAQKARTGRTAPLLDPGSIDLLHRWADEVERRRPDFADEEQWRAKAEVLRAAALALSPQTPPAPSGKARPVVDRWLREWQEGFRAESSRNGPEERGDTR